MNKEKIVLPGDQLSTSEELLSGDGTFEDNFPLGIFSQVLKLGNSDMYELSFLSPGDIIFCRFKDDPAARERTVFFGPVVDSE